MGCVLSLRNSAAGDVDDDVLVSVCRERKRLMKSAVDRRYALAGAHSKYNQSLYAVALALRLFVARHSSSSSSQFLITFPELSPKPNSNLHETESKPAVTKSVEEVAEEEIDDDESTGSLCEHFYDDGTADPTPPVVTSSASGQHYPDDFGGWDFFNPFHNLIVDDGGEHKESRNQKTEDVKVAVADANVSLKVIDAPPLASEDDNGRALLEALKDVEDHFLKAYESGVEFSKLLEFSNVGPLDHLHSKVTENSEKFIPTIAWHKSAVTRSPSCRSLLSSSSRSSSTWTGINSSSDFFEETGGMESGSHLSTLGRLYAWEKKLYDEVKAGNEIKKLYDRKSSQLNGENGKQGVEEQVNDLYSRLLVSIKICDSISKRIEKVRDDELQPQLIELLHGLTKTWKSMLESHKTQSRTMFEVKTFQTASLSVDRSRHLATLQLEAEIQNWQSSFSTYITSIKSYIEALTEWSNRTLTPVPECATPPRVFTICRDWLTVTKNLPDKAVTYAMKRFSKDLRALWAQQGFEHQQQQKVDQLIVELDKRVFGFEREERNVNLLNSKGLNVKNNKVDGLKEKKGKLESFKKMVENEKVRHKDCVEETRRVILVGFQTGFSSVFDSLTEFCEVCVRKYEVVAPNVRNGSNLIRRC